METFFALQALCAGNSPVTGECPSQRPEMRNVDVFLDLCLNKRLSKQSWGWRFEKPSRWLWRHRNDLYSAAHWCWIITILVSRLITIMGKALTKGQQYVKRFHVAVLTHWGRDKMAAVSQTTLSNAFSWMKMSEFRLRFHWSFFLRVQLTIFAGKATSHYLKQWWLNYRRIYASLGLNESNRDIHTNLMRT